MRGVFQNRQHKLFEVLGEITFKKSKNVRVSTVARV